MSKLKKIVIAVYLAVMVSLGFLMHTTDYFRIFAYSSVVLAFVMNLILFRKTAAQVATVVALLFTLGADYFLVIRGDSYPFAMVLFSVAQLAYATRIWFGSSDSARRVELIVRGGVALLSILLPFLVLGSGADFLSVISVFYFGQLILNCVFSATLVEKRNYLLIVGLVLFLFCDIFVGFGNLSAYLPIEKGTLAWWLAHPPINMAWVFYLPSQALLGISNAERAA